MLKIHYILATLLVWTGCSPSSVRDGRVVVSKASHEEFVTHSPKPVVLEFWASWCGPCKAMEPIIAKVSAEDRDVAFGKINVDAEPELAARYDVQAIPTLVLVVKGKVQDRKVGLLSEQSLRAFIRASDRVKE